MASSGPRQHSSGAHWGYTVLGFMLITVIIAAGVAAVYFIYRAVLDFFTSASPQIGSAVIGTAGLVFVAVIANLGAKYLERRQQIQQEQRTKKAEIYEEFMAFWFRLLTGDEADKEDSSPEFHEEVEDYIRGFTHKLVAWGSESFLREYGSFKEKIKHDTDGALLHFEKVLREVRRDLGYRNRGLRKGDLLKVFLDEPGVDALIAAEGHIVEKAE